MSKTKAARLFPHLQEEIPLWGDNKQFVFGVDEAGRGCLAGPVCAAVASWSPFSSFKGELPVPVRDSKQMAAAERERCAEPVAKLCQASGVGFANSEEIDRWNIYRATHLAVARALELSLQQLQARGICPLTPFERGRVAFLTDGNKPLVSLSGFFVRSPLFQAEFPLLTIIFRRHLMEKCIVKGDSKVFSIASASVLAKVSRDRLMRRLDKKFPAYGFARHKGYSTAEHVRILNELGPIDEHRVTFAPVREALERKL